MHATKTFRLFISSTFNDFRKERERLQTRVFPNIREYCSSHGYTFQPIDLRWGISHEAQLDQKTLDLCLEEVRECKRFQHPNFLIMLGDRYGWVPLPYMIEKEELEGLLEFIPSAVNKDDLLEWYKEDLNQIPVSYILKERKNEYIDFKCWEGVENRLKSILQNAVNKSKLNEEQRRKYFLSATEAEVVEGIIPYYKPTRFQQEELLKNDLSLENLDPQHIFGFFRSIDTSTRQHDMFIDNDDDYEQAQKFKERVESVLPNNNRLHIDTKQLSQDTLDETYLIEFELAITSFIKAQIDVQKAKETDESLTPLQIELQAQRYFAQEKRKNFIGQESILNDISSYIVDDNTQPLVIYAISGMGKSALMAKAIEMTDSQKKVIYRFIGATPNSSSSKEILTSIFEELGIDVKSDNVKNKHSDHFLDTINNNQETFELFSYRIYKKIMTIKDEIIIFIDAVDKLNNPDQFLWLPSSLPSNVKIVISTFYDENNKENSIYFEALKRKTINTQAVPIFSEPIKLLNTLLESCKRTLTEKQRAYFLKQYSQSPSPLYVSIAVQELKNWKSFDLIDGDQSQIGKKVQDLQLTQHGIIREYISNLYEFYHHNESFVNRILGYVYASRDGLSEHEILRLISEDNDFIKRMSPSENHDNPTNDLPTVHWSRLYTQLKPFFSKKSQDGEELMHFHHREFEAVINSLLNQQEEYESMIHATQKLIAYNQNNNFNANRWGKLYAILITDYELKYNGDKRKEFADFITSINNIEWVGSYLEHLEENANHYFENNKVLKAICYYTNHTQASYALYSRDPEGWADHYSHMPSNLGNLLLTLDRYDEAIKLHNESLHICEVLYQENSDKWANKYTWVLGNLGVFYQALKRYDKAIEFQEQCLHICEVLYQENSDKWADRYIDVLVNLSLSYRDLNRHDEAIKIQKISLNISEALYRENPDKWARKYSFNLMILSLSYRDLSRYDEAIELQKTSLNICEFLYSENPDGGAERYLQALNNLAVLHNIFNCYAEAIELQRKGLNICEDLYIQNSDRWAIHYSDILNTLSFSYYNLNYYNEAVELQQKNLNICEIKYKVYPTTWAEAYTRALDILAVSYHGLNRHSEAMELQKKNLNMCEILYKENPDPWAESYIIALNNLAHFYYDLNYLDKALELQKKNLNICKALYAKNSERWDESYFRANQNIKIYTNAHKDRKKNEEFSPGIFSYLLAGLASVWFFTHYFN